MPNTTLIIFGAPGSGKGSQCELLTRQFSLVHISSGDLLRQAIKEGNATGIAAKKYIDKGLLVPDDVVIALIQNRLAQPDAQARGWVLDGFPRTAVQAAALQDSGVRPDFVLVLEVPLERLIERTVGRRIDSETGRIYHIQKDSALLTPEIRARLTQRNDDTEETCRERFKIYEGHVGAVLEFYRDRCCRLDGDREKEEVFTAVCGVIGKL